MRTPLAFTPLSLLSGRLARLAALLATFSIAAGAFAAAPPAEIVATDRLIVRLAGGAPAQSKSAADRVSIAARLTARTGELMQPLRVMGDGAQVMQLFRRLPSHAIAALAASAAGDPDVLEILPDRIFFPALAPTDPSYASQWYLNATNGINAPAAWDLTTGSVNLVIGIVDTGKLPHEDLVNRWIGGYDFVSLAARENDSDAGRDADASDPGDWVTSTENASGPLAGCPVTDSRWHGTLMAGVIGAQAGNALGMAGVNWNSKLLPVRVVGKCGGYESDIADGMRWAAGIAVPGVPANVNLADLLNVSLSASGTCTSSLQSAINEVLAAGAPIVVASGNNSVDASGYSPGNCTGVITVGAVDRNGGKAGYTNFGAALALSAPGGKAIEHFSGSDTQANQWLFTTSNQGTTSPAAANDHYANVFGTSVAAAQVTGIASLMLSVHPVLSPMQVRDILAYSARPFPTGTTGMVPPSQADCTTALCGSGIATATAAVQSAQAMAGVTVRVAANGSRSFGLRGDGTLVGWGNGQLGGAVSLTPLPVVVETVSGIVAIAAGVGHTLALRPEGTAWAWGSNTYGEMGDGTTGGTRTFPAIVPGLSGITAISAGDGYSLVLKSNGTVWSWGKNINGQLGDGTTTNRSAPVPVTALANITAIAAGGRVAAALKSDGTVWHWGFAIGNTPTQVALLTAITAIAAGDNHLLALKGDGTVWAWGWGSDGQLGNGSTPVFTATPAAVSGATGVVAIAAGRYTSFAVKGDGTVWAWGSGSNGGLGNGSTAMQTNPVPVLVVTGVIAVSAGSNHSLALRSDGSVWGWGTNGTGALGQGNYDTFSYSTPVQVLRVGGDGFLHLSFLADFVAQSGAPLGSNRVSNTIRASGIADGAAVSIAGGEYSIGCTATFTSAPGTLNNYATVCVRQSAAAICGTTTTATLSVAGLAAKPFDVTTPPCDTTPDAFGFTPRGHAAPSTAYTSGAATITGIAGPAPVSVAGGEYSIGCTAGFTASAGTITNGQTVCVRQTSAATPDTMSVATLTVGGVSGVFAVTTAVAAGFTTPARIAANGSRSFGLRGDGTLLTFGDGPLPVVVDTLSGVLEVAAGMEHTLALRPEGAVWAWGPNTYGELGNGTTSARTYPAVVPGLSAITAISAGDGYSLSRKSDGTVWAWGRNENGRLGDGTTTNRSTPVALSALAGVTAVAAGGKVGAALKSDGSVWQWGLNFTSTPAQAAGVSAVTAIAAGEDHLLALKGDGTVWAWGGNNQGQLGRGNTSAFSATPTMVAGLANVVAIAAGRLTSFAMQADGTLWAWGYGFNGALGNGSTTMQTNPVQVLGVTGVTAVSAGSNHSLALRSDGSVWGWGINAIGALGQGSSGSYTYLTPVPVLGGVTGSTFLHLPFLADFVAQGGVPLSSVRVSNTIRASGIADGAAVSIGGGEYSIGCTGTFTNASGTLDNHATVCVRQTSSAACNATTTATLTVAGLSAKPFDLTTLSCDITPDAFGFTPRGHAALGTAYTSNAATITGISDPAPISVAGGEYSIGCTAGFTAAAGTIANGQTVCVRQTSAATPNTVSDATLTVGGVSAIFTLTTAVAAGFTTPARIAANDWRSFGVRRDGTLLAWGGFVPLGGAVTFTTLPVVVETLSGILEVAAGMEHTLALRPEGTVWAWGKNTYGEMGDGTTGSTRAYPAVVPGLSAITAISAGDGYSLARKSDGTVWAWGRNDNGRLGDGTTAHRSAPVALSALTSVTAVAAGGKVGAALKSDGSVWQWGMDFTSTPAQAAVLAGITAIAAGERHLLALKGDGTVWSWGGNSQGQLGNGTTNYFSATPAAIGGLTNVVAIAAGAVTSFAVKADGTVWAWGWGTNGILGNGANDMQTSPVQVLGPTGVIAVAAGSNHSLALGSDGSVWGWGINGPGTLGQDFNGAYSYNVPVQVLHVDGDGFLDLLNPDTRPAAFAFLPLFNADPLAWHSSNAISVSGLGDGVASPVTVTGGEYAVNGGAFTSAAGSVVNGNSVVVRVMSSAAQSTTTSATLAIGGASGRSSTFHVRTRSDPSAAKAVPMVAGGDSHTYLLASDGTVLAAGYNGNGQLGNGTALGLSTLRPVAGLSGALSIASGAYHGLALRVDGAVAAWGSNAAGQLGHNSTNGSEQYFVTVAGLGGAVGISAGRYHSAAVKGDGTVWAWGLNTEGQVGDGTSVSMRLAPVQVTGLVGVTAVAAGGRHTLALLADGSVRAWGANEAGQLGDISTTQRSSPVAVSGLSNVIAIAAGDAHSLALKNDGTVVAWGFNAFGQLGDGTTTNRLTPVAVSSLGTGVGLIAAGANHSLAVKAGGSLYAWGNNANSQLGNGNNANQSSPVLLAAPTAVVAIAGGARHSAAITANRKLYVWGDNFFGQIGNRSGNYSPHSASLNVLRGDSVISTGTEGSGGGVGTGTNSGSSILEVDGQQTGFDFGSIAQSTVAPIAGKYKNASATEDVTGISIAVTGTYFGLSANTCPTTLTPDAECSFTLAFNPLSAGTFPGELVVTSSVVGSPERRSLFGTGVPPATAAIAFASNGLDFPPQTVGAATSPSLHTVTNTGNANLSITSIASTLGDFTPGHSCTNIAPGASCAISVVFTPAAAGGRTAYLTVNSNASGTPHSVTVYGTGVATLTPNYTLTVNRNGTGTGTVTSVTPAGGINCGVDCSESYASGTVVTLSAAATSGSSFAGWDGGGCSGTGTCQVTMNAATTVTATFNLSVSVRSEFNGDGRSDVLWRDSTNGYVYQWQMNGFTISGQGYLPSVPANWSIAGLGDVSGDGRADVLWRDSTGLNYLWTMNGLAIASQGYLPSVPNSWNIVGMGDANGDGRADVFWRNPATGQNYLWVMNGLAIASQGYLPTVAGSDWEAVGVADYSGDGKADVFWRNKTTGQNYLWVMNGLTVSSQGFLTTIASTDWEVVGSPDANADGKADVLWRNKITGQNYLWVMSGLAISSQGYLPSVADANWKVAGYGDYNGDGRGDVLWRHATSGQNYLWTLNGIAVATQGYLPSVAGANWQPVKR